MDTKNIKMTNEVDDNNDAQYFRTHNNYVLDLKNKTCEKFDINKHNIFMPISSNSSLKPIEDIYRPLTNMFNIIFKGNLCNDNTSVREYFVSLLWPCLTYNTMMLSNIAKYGNRKVLPTVILVNSNNIDYIIPLVNIILKVFPHYCTSFYMDDIGDLTNIYDFKSWNRDLLFVFILCKEEFPKQPINFDPERTIAININHGKTLYNPKDSIEMLASLLLTNIWDYVNNGTFTGYDDYTYDDSFAKSVAESTQAYINNNAKKYRNPNPDVTLPLANTNITNVLITDTATTTIPESEPEDYIMVCSEDTKVETDKTTTTVIEVEKVSEVQKEVKVRFLKHVDCRCTNAEQKFMGQVCIGDDDKWVKCLDKLCGNYFNNIVKCKPDSAPYIKLNHHYKLGFNPWAFTIDKGDAHAHIKKYRGILERPNQYYHPVRYVRDVNNNINIECEDESVLKDIMLGSQEYIALYGFAVLYKMQLMYHENINKTVHEEAEAFRTLLSDLVKKEIPDITDEEMAKYYTIEYPLELEDPTTEVTQVTLDEPSSEVEKSASPAETEEPTVPAKKDSVVFGYKYHYNIKNFSSAENKLCGVVSINGADQKTCLKRMVDNYIDLINKTESSTTSYIKLDYYPQDNEWKYSIAYTDARYYPCTNEFKMYPGFKYLNGTLSKDTGGRHELLINYIREHNICIDDENLLVKIILGSPEYSELYATAVLQQILAKYSKTYTPGCQGKWFKEYIDSLQLNRGPTLSITS